MGDGSGVFQKTGLEKKDYHFLGHRVFSDYVFGNKFVILKNAQQII